MPAGTSFLDLLSFTIYVITYQIIVVLLPSYWGFTYETFTFAFYVLNLHFRVKKMVKTPFLIKKALFSLFFFEKRFGSIKKIPIFATANEKQRCHSSVGRAKD